MKDALLSFGLAGNIDIVSVIYLLKKFTGFQALVTGPTDEGTVGRPANTIIREARVTLALDKVSLETYQKTSLRKKTKRINYQEYDRAL